MQTKHAAELVDLLRKANKLSCMERRTETATHNHAITQLNTSWDDECDEHEVIIVLGNGRRISALDLEFAKPVQDVTGKRIELGNFTFFCD